MDEKEVALAIVFLAPHGLRIYDREEVLAIQELLCCLVITTEIIYVHFPDENWRLFVMCDVEPSSAGDGDVVLRALLDKNSWVPTACDKSIGVFTDAGIDSIPVPPQNDNFVQRQKPLILPAAVAHPSVVRVSIACCVDKLEDWYKHIIVVDPIQ